ncbi:MAG: hypothetical protein R3E96_13150 [Planctomycetota bacterium]
MTAALLLPPLTWYGISVKTARAALVFLDAVLRAHPDQPAAGGVGLARFRCGP